MFKFKDKKPEYGQRILVFFANCWKVGTFHKDGDENFKEEFLYIDGYQSRKDATGYWMPVPTNPIELE